MRIGALRRQRTVAQEQRFDDALMLGQRHPHAVAHPQLQPAEGGQPPVQRHRLLADEAIAAGAVTGAGLGASAQAAMVTRGFVELRRIGAAFGARPETLMGLSGLGDLLLTCSSTQSRNFAYGLALGQGKPLAGLPLAEGVPTAAIAARLASERGIDAPIIAATAAILDGALTIGQAVTALMTRPLKTETDS